MPCFGKWVRGPDQEIVVTATSEDDLEFLTLLRETVLRDVDDDDDEVMIDSFDQEQLAAGVEWTLDAAHQRYRLTIVAHPFPATVSTQITVGGAEIFNEDCETGAAPMAARFRVSVKA